MANQWYMPPEFDTFGFYSALAQQQPASYGMELSTSDLLRAGIDPASLVPIDGYRGMYFNAKTRDGGNVIVGRSVAGENGQWSPGVSIEGMTDMNDPRWIRDDTGSIVGRDQSMYDQGWRAMGNDAASGNHLSGLYVAPEGASLLDPVFHKNESDWIDTWGPLLVGGAALLGSGGLSGLLGDGGAVSGGEGFFYDDWGLGSTASGDMAGAGFVPAGGSEPFYYDDWGVGSNSSGGMSGGGFTPAGGSNTGLLNSVSNLNPSTLNTLGQVAGGLLGSGLGVSNTNNNTNSGSNVGPGGNTFVPPAFQYSAPQAQAYSGPLLFEGGRNQNYGLNPVLNKSIADVTGYQGDFGGGQFQNWLSQNPSQQDEYQQAMSWWNSPNAMQLTGRTPQLPMAADLNGVQPYRRQP